jgi:hypothetical protein
LSTGNLFEQHGPIFNVVNSVPETVEIKLVRTDVPVLKRGARSNNFLPLSGQVIGNMNWFFVVVGASKGSRTLPRSSRVDNGRSS